MFCGAYAQIKNCASSVMALHELVSFASFALCLDKPQVYQITTVFDGKYHNPNLLIWTQGSQKIFISFSN